MGETKERFIEEVNKIIEETNLLSQDSIEYFKQVICKPTKATKITENGKKILSHMKENSDMTFTSATIGAAVGMASRSASGALQKLSKDGYVDKVKDSKPVAYQITDFGKKCEFDN